MSGVITNHHAVLLARYPWITELTELRTLDQGDVLVVQAGKEFHYLPLDHTRTDVFQKVCEQLNEIACNRALAADTEDWYDAPQGGQHE